MSSTLRLFIDALSTGFLLCFVHYFSLKLSALVFLIYAEAKTKKDDLMVHVNDLEECEFGKNTIFVFSSHWKIKYDQMVPIKPMR